MKLNLFIITTLFFVEKILRSYRIRQAIHRGLILVLYELSDEVITELEFFETVH